MDLYQKLLEVSRGFRIDYEYLGYETIQMGNVNHTYKVNFRLPSGEEKSFLVQNVNTYAFRNPVGLMKNIDKSVQRNRDRWHCTFTILQTGRPILPMETTSGE